MILYRVQLIIYTTCIEISREGGTGSTVWVCVCVFFFLPIHFGHQVDVPAGVTKEEGHTGFFIHLPSAVRALFFLARSIQPFLALVDREVEFCVLKV